MRSRRLRTLLAMAACGLAPAWTAAPGYAAAHTTVAHTQPGWATPANRTGAAAGDERLAFSVWLGWRNPAGLDATLADLYDPGSPANAHWLTPDEFRARYSPPQAQV